MQFKILFEDPDILVCEKPAGIPTQTKNTSMQDMVSLIRNYLAEEKKSTDKIPYVGLIHRLDQPVGGIMVFAKNQKAAGNLSQQIAKKQMHKDYFAVITQDLTDELGKMPSLLTDYMITDKAKNTSRIVETKSPQAKSAQLRFQVLSVVPYNNQFLSLIRVNLLTGRHHQIRVQTACHLGGIWGDKKYNPMFQADKNHTSLGLYSCQLNFKHPKTNKQMEFYIFPKFDIFNLFHVE